MLLFAAAEDASLAVQNVLQLREIIEDLLGYGTGPGWVGQHAHLQILQHRQLWEDLAALRHIADTCPRPDVRGGASEVSVLEQNSTAARAEQAHDALQERRLADAVAAHETHYLTRADFKVDVAQDLSLTVRHLQLFDAQHQFRDPLRDRLE